VFGLIIILISLTSKNLQPQESTKLLHNKCNSYVTSHTISYIDNLYAPEPLIWMCTTETSRMWGKRWLYNITHNFIHGQSPMHLNS